MRRMSLWHATALAIAGVAVTAAPAYADVVVGPEPGDPSTWIFWAAGACACLFVLAMVGLGVFLVVRILNRKKTTPQAADNAPVDPGADTPQ